MSSTPSREDLLSIMEAAVDVQLEDKYQPYIEATTQAMVEGMSKGPEYNLRLMKMLAICNYQYEQSRKKGAKT